TSTPRSRVSRPARGPVTRRATRPSPTRRTSTGGTTPTTTPRASATWPETTCFRTYRLGRPRLVHTHELQLVGPMTADEVAAGDFLPGGRLGPAHVDRVRAARMEIAARRRRRRIRHLALQDDAPRAQARVRLGHRGQERRRVGMLRGREQRLG